MIVCTSKEMTSRRLDQGSVSGSSTHISNLGRCNQSSNCGKSSNDWSSLDGRLENGFHELLCWCEYTASMTESCGFNRFVIFAPLLCHATATNNARRTPLLVPVLCTVPRIVASRIRVIREAWRMAADSVYHIIALYSSTLYCMLLLFY